MSRVYKCRVWLWTVQFDEYLIEFPSGEVWIEDLRLLLRGSRGPVGFVGRLHLDLDRTLVPINC